jgi:hypothetical protein
VQLVRISGPTEPMRRLGEVAGLDFERTSARRVADDRWQVSGYASDEAEDLSEQRSVLFSKLDDDHAREAQN